MLASRLVIPLRFYCIKAIPIKKIEKELSKREKESFLVPPTPIKSKIDLKKLPPRTQIDAETITLLERLSLVDCANKQSVQILEDAIAFADQIQQFDTSGVEPLTTVLEDRPLTTREDHVTEENRRTEVLKNAVLTEEDYFVAPTGNIPLEA